jgi:hypothetical protein
VSLEDYGMASDVVLERVIKRQISSWLKKFVAEHDDAHYWMPAGNLFSSSLPDYMLLYKGSLICIEAKSSVGKQTELQKVVAAKIVAAGGKYIIIRDKAGIDGLSEQVSWQGSTQFN